MGNVALSAEDVSFLKEKGANKTTTSEIKKAFKEFAEVLLIFKKYFLKVKHHLDMKPSSLCIRVVGIIDFYFILAIYLIF